MTAKADSSDDCPICGGRLLNEELKLHQDVVYSLAGSMPLGPVHHAMVRMFKENPGGLTTNGVADRTGQSINSTQVELWMLKNSLTKIGWTIRNIGCRGRGNALYVLAAHGQ